MDIFKEVLPELDKGNIDFIKNLSEKELKELQPYILMKFMSASKSSPEYHMMAVNEVVNKGFWSLKDHKQLQLFLLAICGVGKKQFHYFPGKGATESKLHEFVGKCYPSWKEDEIKMFVDMADKDTIINLAIDYGYQDKEIKELKKLMKD